MGPLLKPAAPRDAKKLAMSLIPGPCASYHFPAAIWTGQGLLHAYQLHGLIIHSCQYEHSNVFLHIWPTYGRHWDGAENPGPEHRTPGLDVPTYPEGRIGAVRLLKNSTRLDELQESLAEAAFALWNRSRIRL